MSFVSDTLPQGACVLLNIYLRLQWICDAKFMCPMFSKNNANSPSNVKTHPIVILLALLLSIRQKAMPLIRCL